MYKNEGLQHSCQQDSTAMVKQDLSALRSAATDEDRDAGVHWWVCLRLLSAPVSRGETCNGSATRACRTRRRSCFRANMPKQRNCTSTRPMRTPPPGVNTAQAITSPLKTWQGWPTNAHRKPLIFQKRLRRKRWSQSRSERGQLCHGSAARAALRGGILLRKDLKLFPCPMPPSRLAPFVLPYK